MRHPETIELAEEAYILASETNGPLHPLVQKVATQLVDLIALYYQGIYRKQMTSVVSITRILSILLVESTLKVRMSHVV